MSFSLSLSANRCIVRVADGAAPPVHPKISGQKCDIRPNTTQRRSVEKVPVNDWQASVTLILLVFHRLDLEEEEERTLELLYNKEPRHQCSKV